MYDVTYHSNRTETYYESGELPIDRTLNINRDDFLIGVNNRYSHVLTRHDKVLLLPDFVLCVVWDIQNPNGERGPKCIQVAKIQLATGQPFIFHHTFVSYTKLLFPQVRKDNKLTELRHCTVNWGERNSSSPHLTGFYPGSGSSDLKFKNEFLKRPLKVLSIGDPVFLLPEFKVVYFVGLWRSSDRCYDKTSEDIVLSKKAWDRNPATRFNRWFRVPLDRVLYLQTYHRPNTGRAHTDWKVLLKVDFRPNNQNSHQQCL